MLFGKHCYLVGNKFITTVQSHRIVDISLPVTSNNCTLRSLIQPVKRKKFIPKVLTITIMNLSLFLIYQVK